MQVRDAMAKTIATASPTDTVRRVAQLMKQEEAGFIPITEGERLRGVVTDRDLVVRCLAQGHGNPLDETIEHCMSTGIRTVDPNADLETAASIMEEEEVRRLAVVENGRLVGVLSHGNLVQATRGEGPAQRATVGVSEGA